MDVTKPCLSEIFAQIDSLFVVLLTKVRRCRTSPPTRHTRKFLMFERLPLTPIAENYRHVIW